MDPINPRFRNLKPADTPSAEQLFTELTAGKRAALSRALTLAESKLGRHREIADELIHRILPYSGKSIRIGITGVPGVGKSTFIEAFGTYLTSIGKKVAVLAVDPSSIKNKGSILGDKTRMEKLSQNKNAFIRPSPSAGSLGGVTYRTRESILLCEAAGFDVILVETVGVGQSETAVKSMVDFFLLLMLAGAGDELQGIKRGIMEMADLLVINKADGENIKASRLAQSEYKRALHLFPPNENEWIPRVETVSSIQEEGLENIWAVVQEFERLQKLKNYFEKNRRDQALAWFEEALGALFLDALYRSEKYLSQIEDVKKEIAENRLEPVKAAREFVDLLTGQPR